MNITDNFTVKGFYYTNTDIKFRKYLEIKSHNTTNPNLVPDLMVIMMNPGSSRPLDENNNGCTLTPAFPDRTQNQIMKVMENTNHHYARILNLSDLRTPHSNELYMFINSDENNEITHSLFCPERNDELNSLFIQDVPVICGWGINTTLRPLAEQALQVIKNSLVIGDLKRNTQWAYYHPLPPVYSKQAAWVESISNQLNNC